MGKKWVFAILVCYMALVITNNPACAQETKNTTLQGGLIDSTQVTSWNQSYLSNYQIVNFSKEMTWNAKLTAVPDMKTANRLASTSIVPTFAFCTPSGQCFVVSVAQPTVPTRGYSVVYRSAKPISLW